MQRPPKDEKTIGLYLEKDSLKAAFITSIKKNITIEKLLDVKPLYNLQGENEDLANLKTQTNHYLTASALSASEVLMRRLHLKLKKEKEIEEAYPFQAEQYLPYPIETAILNKIILEKENLSTQIAFLSVKKETLKKHLESFQSLQLDPEAVTSETVALAAFADKFLPHNTLLFIIHIGKEKTISTLLRNGKPISSFELQLGVDSVLKSLEEKKNFLPVCYEELFSYQEVESLPGFQALLNGIHWNYLAQIKETKTKETPSLLVLGEGALLPKFTGALSETLQAPLETLNELNDQHGLSEIISFAIPIGIALSFQTNYATPIDFRKSELSFSRPWRRFKKPLLLYSILSLTLSFSLFLFGASTLVKAENTLRKNYLDLLSFSENKYEDFEKKYISKYPINTTLPIQNITPKDIEERLAFMKGEIKSTPEIFPLMPSVARVTEVLTWLTHHSAMTCEGDKECEKPFLIENFSYVVAKRPEINKPKEKYQIRVEFEFETTSPKIAREFHDALIAPNDFVDPKMEVKWNATKGKYKTSFYLKDKTIYPK